MKKFIFAALCGISTVVAQADTNRITYGYCGEPNSTVGVAWQEYTMLVEFPKSFVNKYNGAKIVAVEVASPTSWVQDSETEQWSNTVVNNFIDATLCFYTEKKLEAEPFYSQDIELSEKPFTWSTYPLTTPITIDKSKPFYVGYAGLAPTADDTCFAVDMNYSNDNVGCWLGWEGKALDDAGNEIVDEDGNVVFKEVWMPYTEWYGNMCLRLVIEGDNLPTNEISIDAFTAPGYVQTGKEFEVSATVTNHASNTISNVGMSYTLNGKTYTLVGELDKPIEYKESGDATFKGLVCDQTTDLTSISYKFNAINGVTIGVTITDNTEGKFYLRAMPEGVGYQRNVVIEEGTGTWCGYCPMGIVAMQNLEEKYDHEEQFIPIAVHYDDKMAIDEYSSYINTYCSAGLPMATINRDVISIGAFTPEPVLVEFAYEYAKEVKAIAKIDLDAKYNEDKTQLNVTTTTNFAIETNSNYTVYLVMTQDNVGPYKQTNYFSDYGEGVEMGGFELLDDPVELTYNDVAVCFESIGDVEGSAPGNNYTLSSTLSFADYKTIKDVNNIAVIAMVVNKKSGLIENATKLEFNGEAGIDAVTETAVQPSVMGVNGAINVTAAEGATSVYTMSGSMVAQSAAEGDITFNLPAGLYIVKSGNYVAKVAVK